MNLTRPLLLFALATTFCGCTKQSLPGFEEAIPMSVKTEGPSLGPRLVNQNGMTTLSWMERAEQGATLRFARYFDHDWRDITDVTEDPKMFVNWADLPAVTPLGDKQYLAHWLRYSADETYSYDVVLSRSADAGVSWSDPYRPHDDGTTTEHGFVSTYPMPDGTGLLWLDGRNTPESGMTLRAATVNDTSEVFAEAEVDNYICDCCQTDVAVASSGPVAVYRDRSREEVRDIYVSRLIDGAWTPGIAVANDGWVISGCPVNGPAIDAMGDLVVTGWFTGASDKPLVQVAVSKNSGETFLAPIAVAQRGTLGRVGVAILDETSYIVTWLENDRIDGFNIRMRAFTLDGQVGSVWTVGKTSLMRTVPQLARDGDELLFAWTDQIDDGLEVVSVRMKIVDFYD